jgi:hypothetical protein
MDHTKVDVLCATARLVVPVVSRTKSAIRNSATQHFHHAQQLRLVRGYDAIYAYDMKIAAGMKARARQQERSAGPRRPYVHKAHWPNPQALGTGDRSHDGPGLM